MSRAKEVVRRWERVVEGGRGVEEGSDFLYESEQIYVKGEGNEINHNFENSITILS